MVKLIVYMQIKLTKRESSMFQTRSNSIVKLSNYLKENFVIVNSIFNFVIVNSIFNLRL